ncbi:hypothetical protein [Zobellia galactanivorans]|uniref:Hypothetical lipoprotein n=1 Tax=Zobellia galactanivorans (strain DSM 12802 / CCUG 47099 / CIP 106680 / NCIMB 13871 / Dsij) TaxID=63186 RepID=G0LCM0_ZOBGA|nr:hypothetical protein [Zobellia galactanivorans]MBU3025477.1 hypothetical protein [Zobellia galactanivorans]CAZ97018.1 Hypothetical lipoprotein [Zobellia galactanivorans]
MIKYIKNILAALVVTASLFSCEQERLDPVLTTAEGGGTLNEYMAYTIESTDPSGSNVTGRVVFYKTTLDQTLVQVSLDSPEFSALYDSTDPFEIVYPSAIMGGAVGTEITTMMTLYDVKIFAEQFDEDDTQLDTDDYDRDGDTEEYLPLLNFYAEFEENKFYVIDEAGFYEGISEMDSHINIYDVDGTTIIASGDLGLNAEPVESN